MENNTQAMQAILDSEAQNAAAQQQEQSVQQEDMQLQLRAQELITQARTILAVARVDVLAVYNTDLEVRSRILSGEMDFIDVWKAMKPAQIPPVPMRSANGGVGTVNIGGMSETQFEKLNRMLSRGGKVDMRY